MKNKKTVRLGAAALLFPPGLRKQGFGWERFFDFCESHLPGSGCDVVLLPEFCGGTPEDREEVGKGPISRAFASLAREHNLYLIAPLAEKKNGKKYNATVVYSPQGKVLYSYRKVHLAPSEYKVHAPGDRFGTFKLPWFTGGIMTCFDNQMPESSRILALLGADVVFLPSFGDLNKPHRDPARCLDNHLFLVGSPVIDLNCGLPGSAFQEGKILDPRARVLAHTGAREGLAIAELPLKNGKLVRVKDAGNSIGFEVDYLKCRRPRAYGPLVR